MNKQLLTIGLICLTQLLQAQSFQNVAAANSIIESYGQGSFGGGVSFCDFNGDGWDDLTFSSEAGDPIHFFQNNNGTLTKLAPLVGETDQSKQILWVDYDNDGDKDLFVTNMNAPNRLYQNDGSMNLTDVTAAAGLHVENDPSYGATFGDFNNDGWLDIYVANHSLGTGCNCTNYLYQSDGDGTFTDITTATTAEADALSFCSAAFDFDKDGDQDIYTAIDRFFSNSLLANDGNANFSDVSAASGTNIVIDAMNVGLGDYDNDGDEDIYVTNTPGGNVLLCNQGDGTFSDCTAAAGVGFFRVGWGGNFVDYDNDGDLDLYVSSMRALANEPNALYENQGNGTFTEPLANGLPGDTVTSFANAIGDLNNDGYPDFAVSNYDTYAHMVWQNQNTNANNFVKVELVGTLSNRDGIGSWIEVYAGGETYYRYTHSGIAFLAQNSSYENIGIGTAATIDSIKVKWLSGMEDVRYNVSINQKITITESCFEEVASAQNITTGYGTGFVGGGISFADFNNDGWDDLSFATNGTQDLKFYQNMSGSFQSVSLTGVSLTAESKQILWVDYDNDGDQDLFVANYDSQNRLYQNNGSMVMTDITNASGLKIINDPSMGASFGDYDNDGYLDLYVINYDLFSNPLYSNFLYRNKGDGTFEDKTIEAGVGDANKIPLCAGFLDYDKDGYQDIYIAIDRTNFANTMLHNNGDGTFTDVSATTNSNLLIDAMNVGVADYDEDGDLDIYISNTPAGGNKLLRNNLESGTADFTEVSVSAGVNFNRVGWGANFFDFDNDSDLDLYASSMNPVASQPNALYRSEGDGTFKEILVRGLPGDTVKSFSNAIGDFDNNGYPDVAVCNDGTYNFMLWQNKINSGHNYLKVKLQGVASNRDGIGSWVEFYLNGDRHTRYLMAGEAYLGQNSKIITMGLGAETSVDSVVVRWLSGAVSKQFDVAANQVVTIVENALLPAELLSFSGVPIKNEYIQLSWVTASEKEVFGYEVQRSTSRDRFEKIAWVNSNGNSYQTQNYGHDDDQIPGNGNYYYRLKVVNLDGTHAYSNIISVRVPLEAGYVLHEIFPNPVASNQLFIDLESSTPRQMQFSIFNTIGQLVFAQNIDLFEGDNRVELPIENWANGQYFIKMDDSILVTTSRFIVQR